MGYLMALVARCAYLYSISLINWYIGSGYVGSRDKLYAILFLANDIGQNDFEIDYDKSREEVMLNVAILHYNKHSGRSANFVEAVQ